MEPSVLRFALTADERTHFDKLGYLVVPDALGPGLVERFSADAADIFDRAVARGHDAQMPLIYHELLYEGRHYRDLTDWPRTFPKIWGILGCNIWIYHCHLIVTPSTAAPTSYPTLTWHQDSGTVNAEMDGGSPRPRLSLKCSYFLSDCSREGMGNFCVVPGSHLQDVLERPGDGSAPEGAIQVLAKPGDAVLFDRRTWHAASPNHCGVTRKVLTLGYGYRWVWRKDNTDLKPLAAFETPIRAQLLGAGDNQSRYGGQTPLADWVREHDAAGS